VLAYNHRPVSSDFLGDINFVDLDIFFKESDYLSLLCSLLEGRYEIVNKDTLQ